MKEHYELWMLINGPPGTIDCWMVWDRSRGEPRWFEEKGPALNYLYEMRADVAHLAPPEEKQP